MAGCVQRSGSLEIFEIHTEVTIGILGPDDLRIKEEDELLVPGGWKPFQATWVAVPRPTAELLLQVAVEAASLPNTVCVCAHVFLKDLCEKSSHPSDCLYVIKSDLESEEH